MGTQNFDFAFKFSPGPNFALTFRQDDFSAIFRQPEI